MFSIVSDKIGACKLFTGDAHRIKMLNILERGAFVLKILYRSSLLVFIIVLGYLLKSSRLFSKERDFVTLSNLILYITLPAAILTNLNGLRFPISLLLISLFGFLCNWLYILIARKVGKDKNEQSFLSLGINGYNIGNFSLPFISFFLEGIPILAVSLFDAGSAIMGLSGNFAVAEGIEKEQTSFRYRDLFKKIIQSPPIVAYIVMVVLSLASIDLPPVIIDIASLVGSANTFLAMFMIGVALELDFDHSRFKKLLKYMFLRYLPAILLAVVISFLSFIPDEITYALTLVLMAPIAGSSTIFIGLLGKDVELSAQVNSLSIILSIVLMSSYLVYLGV